MRVVFEDQEVPLGVSASLDERLGAAHDSFPVGTATIKVIGIFQSIDAKTKIVGPLFHDPG